MGKVTVYYFKFYNSNTDKEVCSKRMATYEFIKGIQGAERLKETAKEVNVTDLDNGRYPKTESIAN